MAWELYLDSSALVKLYVREPESGDLSVMVRRHTPPLPFSSLHELELTHALERRCAEGDLARATVASITTAIETDLGTGVLLRPACEWASVFARSIQLLRRHRGLRSLDALHVGLALELDCPSFVTYDLRQAKAAEAEGLQLWP
jgi:uncharacterized protein